MQLVFANQSPEMAKLWAQNNAILEMDSFRLQDILAWISLAPSNTALPLAKARNGQRPSGRRRARGSCVLLVKLSAAKRDLKDYALGIAIRTPTARRD
jgi:hypothetical protein